MQTFLSSSSKSITKIPHEIILAKYKYIELIPFLQETYKISKKQLDNIETQKSIQQRIHDANHILENAFPDKFPFLLQYCHEKYVTNCLIKFISKKLIAKHKYDIFQILLTCHINNWRVGYERMVRGIAEETLNDRSIDEYKISLKDLIYGPDFEDPVYASNTSNLSGAVNLKEKISSEIAGSFIKNSCNLQFFPKKLNADLHLKQLNIIKYRQEIITDQQKVIFDHILSHCFINDPNLASNYIMYQNLEESYWQIVNRLFQEKCKTASRYSQIFPPFEGFAELGRLIAEIKASGISGDSVTSTRNTGNRRNSIPSKTQNLKKSATRKNSDTAAAKLTDSQPITFTLDTLLKLQSKCYIMFTKKLHEFNYIVELEDKLNETGHFKYESPNNAALKDVVIKPMRVISKSAQEKPELSKVRLINDKLVVQLVVSVEVKPIEVSYVIPIHGKNFYKRHEICLTINQFETNSNMLGIGKMCYGEDFKFPSHLEALYDLKLGSDPYFKSIDDYCLHYIISPLYTTSEKLIKLENLTTKNEFDKILMLLDIDFFKHEISNVRLDTDHAEVIFAIEGLSQIICSQDENSGYNKVKARDVLGNLLTKVLTVLDSDIHGNKINLKNFYNLYSHALALCLNKQCWQAFKNGKLRLQKWSKNLTTVTHILIPTLSLACS